METWVKSWESVIHPKYFSSVYIWTLNENLVATQTPPSTICIRFLSMLINLTIDQLLIMHCVVTTKMKASIVPYTIV